MKWETVELCYDITLLHSSASQQMESMYVSNHNNVKTAEMQ